MQELFGPRDYGTLSSLYLVTREGWGARPPSRYVPPLPHKANKVTMTFTTKTDACDNTDDCRRIVRQLQQREMDEGQPDITPNFLVGNDGHVYEGRGWNCRAAFRYRRPDDQPEFPDQTLEIAFIGDYEEDADSKYTDPLLISTVVHYVKKKTAEHAHEISEIKKVLEEIKSKIIDIDIALTTKAPPQRDNEEPKEKPLLLNKITREEWGAVEIEDVNEMELMTLPIRKVHLTYSTKTENDEDHVKVAGIVRDIQSDHMRRGLRDISYNFLIGGDGNVYEGRGWYLKPEIAYSDPNWSDGTIDVAFIGDFNRDDYPYELLDFTQDLMNLGVENRVVSEDYEILFD